MNAQQKITGKISAITEITPKSGYEKDILSAATYIQNEASREKGCLLFSVSQKKDAPEVVVFFEIFRDEAALDNHKKEAHTQKFSKLIEGKYKDNKVTFLNTINTLHH
jgi:quinol monooxygenase YgiN